MSLSNHKFSNSHVGPAFIFIFEQERVGLYLLRLKKMKDRTERKDKNRCVPNVINHHKRENKLVLNIIKSPLR